MTDIIIVRHPDYDNDITLFGETEGVVIVDIDLGRADLSDPVEFAEWAEGQLFETRGLNTRAAQRLICEVVRSAAEDFGHDVPRWAL